MPCFSVITNTKMTNSSRIVDALIAAGFTDSKIDNNGTIVGRGNSKNPEIRFLRTSNGSYSTDYQNLAVVGNVGREYALLGVRTWAQRNGYSVLPQKVKDQITLKSSRR